MCTFGAIALGDAITTDISPVSTSVSLQGPGFQRWDVSLFKTYTTGESLHLQICAETFNFLNSAPVSLPPKPFDLGLPGFSF